MSGTRSRSKGNRRELAVMHRFQDACVPCWKTSGMYKPGPDLRLEQPSIGERTIEVKGRANGEGFKTLEKWKGSEDFLVLWRDRAEPLVVLDLSLLLQLMRPL